MWKGKKHTLADTKFKLKHDSCGSTMDALARGYYNLSTYASH